MPQIWGGTGLEGIHSAGIRTGWTCQPNCRPYLDVAEYGCLTSDNRIDLGGIADLCGSSLSLQRSPDLTHRKISLR
jgi:hypothetical protein